MVGSVEKKQDEAYDPLDPRGNRRRRAGPGKSSLARVMPEVWKLVRPLRWTLAGGVVLMIANRLCGFAMSVASRFLINDVTIENKRASEIVSGLIAKEHISFKPADRRESGLHSYKVSGAGVGGEANGSAATVIEQCFSRCDSSRHVRAERLERRQYRYHNPSRPG
jgi:hypothetical protein